MPMRRYKSVFDFLFNVYRVFLRSMFGNACCYQPSCSHYAQEAFQKHGFFYGVYLTVRRLLRCHPFAGGGIDPVPETKMLTKRNVFSE